MDAALLILRKIILPSPLGPSHVKRKLSTGSSLRSLVFLRVDDDGAVLVGVIANSLRRAIKKL